MSKRQRSSKDLGIPQGIAPELRAALAKELKRMGSTYGEIAGAGDMPLSPENVLKMARHWNSLTPEQKAAWDVRAREENMRGGHDPFGN